jgi:hypothetical protein
VKRSNHKGELRQGQYWGGAPAPAYGGPQGYGAAPGFQPQPYNQPGYGTPPPGYQPPPPPGYEAPPPGYGAPPPGYGTPPAPPPPGYQPPPAPGYEPPEQPSFGDPTAPPKDDSAER